MPSISAKAQRLSDVELAVLLSLASDEHCIIHSETESLADLRDEVRLVCSASSLILHRSFLTYFKVASITFGLSHVTIECGTSTTVDDINAGILTNVLQSPKLATSNVCDESAPEDVSGIILDSCQDLWFAPSPCSQSVRCLFPEIRLDGSVVQLLSYNMKWTNQRSI